MVWDIRIPQTLWRLAFHHQKASKSTMQMKVAPQRFLIDGMAPLIGMEHPTVYAVMETTVSVRSLYALCINALVQWKVPVQDDAYCVPDDLKRRFRDYDCHNECIQTYCPCLEASYDYRVELRLEGVDAQGIVSVRTPIWPWVVHEGKTVSLCSWKCLYTHHAQLLATFCRLLGDAGAQGRTADAPHASLLTDLIHACNQITQNPDLRQFCWTACRTTYRNSVMRHTSNSLTKK